jgi:Tfp pilus assembly protein PilN
VTRFNYAPARVERFAASVTAACREPGVRLAIGAIGAGLILVTFVWSFEVRRLAGLDDALRSLHQRLGQAQARDAETQRLQTVLQRLRTIDRRVGLARREAIAATNALVRIGNALPPRTWLTGMQATSNGAWTISGRSTRVAEIGTMLRSIQRIDRGGVTRLVSVNVAGRSSGVLDFVIDSGPAP